MGYEQPTPVQAAALPSLLAGRDALVEAETGSGKTAAFGIPAVVRGSGAPRLQVVVLVPTRELARQVAEEIREIGAGSPFRCVAVTGGVNAEQEERTLGGDVRCVVATPGRLLALLEARKIRLDTVRLVILDEADRMLDMGFAPDVQKVLAAASSREQTVMVSATLPRAVQDLAAAHMREVHEVRVGTSGAPASLSHWRLNVFHGQKEAALVAMLRQEAPERAIVFVTTRKRATAFTKLLKAAGFAADQLQGDMTHDQRRHVFDLFQRGITRVMVATDIAARGLDVPEMQLVVNVDLPVEPDAYSHRGGRAGRMGRPGKIVSMVEPNEKPLRHRLEQESGHEWSPYRLAYSDADLPDAWREPPAAPKGRAPPPRAPPRKPAKENVRAPRKDQRGLTEDLPRSRRERRERE